MIATFKKVLMTMGAGTIVLAAAGCGGNADPVEPTATPPTPSTSAATSPPAATPSPTAKPGPKPIPGSSKGPAKNWPVPKMPDAAKKKSVDGLKAFIAHYYDLLEYTLDTNDSKALRRVTEPECKACFEEFIDTADGNKVAGSWITGADFTPTVTRAIIQGESGVALITLTQEEMLLYTNKGNQYASFPAVKKPLPGSLLLLYADGWKVQSLEVEPEKRK